MKVEVRKKSARAVEHTERTNAVKIIPADDIKGMVYQLHDFFEKTSKIPHMLPDQKDCMLSAFIDRALMRSR